MRSRRKIRRKSKAAEFCVRPFHIADTDAVVALWTQVFPDDPLWNAPATIIASKMHVQPELFLVGTLDGRVVATVIAGFDGMRGWLYHLAVATKHRRRGFATHLVRGAERALRRRGCTKVNLQVRAENGEVVAFYESVGYRVEERVSMGRRLRR